MKKPLLFSFLTLICQVIFAQTNPGINYEPARLTMKDGTVKDVVLEITSPVSMQDGIRVFDPNLLASGKPVAENQKQKLSPSEFKIIRTKKKLYEAKKYADISVVSLTSMGKIYNMEVVKPGKISLYNFYAEGKPVTLLIGKQDEKMKPVSGTSLMKYIEDADPIKEKFLKGGYGNNPKNDNGILNDNLKFIHTLVDEYNEFSTAGRILSGEEKTARRKLNQMIIFDLFMNYELTQKNGNLATIVDYLPGYQKKWIKRIDISSNYGGEDEKTTIAYNWNYDLSQIVYQREGKQYVYDFTYAEGVPVSVNIAGKKKIDFVYSYDTLKSIVREVNGMYAEYDLVYSRDERKADIKFSLVDKGRRRPGTSSQFVTWNENQKITSLNFDMYRMDSITYGEHGGIASFSGRDAEGNEKTAEWEYTSDEKNNWTERKRGEYAAKRTIEYPK